MRFQIPILPITVDSSMASQAMGLYHQDGPEASESPLKKIVSAL
jgi:hypothetical protein